MSNRNHWRKWSTAYGLDKRQARRLRRVSLRIFGKGIAAMLRDNRS